ncbi:cytochrome c3 family protein [Thermodesulfobacteriota bacterium]
MRIKKWVIGIILSVFISTISLAVENKGAEKIQIDAGSRGAVPFMHRPHQDRLGDCNVCHTMFPQEPQSLAKLKKSGQMKPKDVMNKLCIKCHKAEKKAGNNAGPTTCSKCHIR